MVLQQQWVMGHNVASRAKWKGLFRYFRLGDGSYTRCQRWLIDRLAEVSVAVLWIAIDCRQRSLSRRTGWKTFSHRHANEEATLEFSVGWFAPESRSTVQARWQPQLRSRLCIIVLR